MNERIKELAEQAGMNKMRRRSDGLYVVSEDVFKAFAYAIIQECIDKIETYRIPVGNSVSGELACEWTYDALISIRDDIKQEFGVEE